MSNNNREDKSEEARTKQSGGFNKNTVLLFSGMILASAAILAAVFIGRQLKGEPAVDLQHTAVSAGIPIIDANNLEAVKFSEDEKASKTSFTTHMNTIWNFKSAESPSIDAVVGNSASNNYPFFFDVKLSDTGEVIYNSSLVPVGSNVREILLNRDLPEGEYEAILTYHLVDDENNDTVLASDLGFTIEINVQS
ncbi:MAG: hypothetical protein LBS84_12110 [Clostridiales bacterium]|jgi:hypothetical protein|nr:hypothetical protein [Clostridiales bacterium]